MSNLINQVTNFLPQARINKGNKRFKKKGCQCLFPNPPRWYGSVILQEVKYPGTVGSVAGKLVAEEQGNTLER